MKFLLPSESPPVQGGFKQVLPHIKIAGLQLRHVAVTR